MENKIKMPFTMPTRKDIMPIGAMPDKSCWIHLLADNKMIHSMNNLRYGKDMWFDVTDKTLSDTENGTEKINFNEVTLSNGNKPTGWIYK